MFYNYPKEYYINVVTAYDLNLNNNEMRSIEKSYNYETQVDEEYADDAINKLEISE